MRSLHWSARLPQYGIHLIDFEQETVGFFAAPMYYVTELMVLTFAVLAKPPPYVVY